MKLKIKKDDMVIVIAGNEKGKTGRVLQLLPKEMKVLVEGINIRKRHTKPNQQNQKGGIIEKELPINYSNVMIIDSDGNPTRIATRFEESEGKTAPKRVAITNGNDL